MFALKLVQILLYGHHIYIVFSFYINPTVRPSITVISRNQTWNETDDVTLSCNATGKPPPDVTWSNRDSNMKYSGSLLPLKNISRKQDGEYWCTANNTAGNVTAPVRLIVNCKYKN